MCLSSRGKLTAHFVCHGTVCMASVYQLKIKYVQDKLGARFLDAFGTISFPLEDEHVVNEHKCENFMTPHRKNVLTWCISMYHVIGLKQTRSIKNVTRRCCGLLGRVVRKGIRGWAWEVPPFGSYMLSKIKRHFTCICH